MSGLDARARRDAFLAQHHRKNEDFFVIRALVFGLVLNTAALISTQTMQVANPRLMAAGHGTLELVLVFAIVWFKLGHRTERFAGVILFLLAALYGWNLRSAVTGAEAQFVVSASTGYFGMALMAVLFSPVTERGTAILAGCAAVGGLLAMAGHPAWLRWGFTFSMAMVATAFFVGFKRKQSLHIGALEFDAQELNEIKAARLAAEARVLEQDLALAVAAQALLLPAAASAATAHFRLVGRHRPAGRVSGDWWWYEAGEASLAAVVADVAGHGAGAAMIGATSVGTFRGLLARTPEAPDAPRLPVILRGVHDILVGLGGRAVCTATSAIALKPGSCDWWVAGAPPILVARASGEVEIVTASSAPLGYRSFELSHRRVELASGDRVVLFSDGATEMENAEGKELGIARLARLVASTRKASVEASVDDLLAAIDRYRGAVAAGDDLSLVVVEHL